MAHARPRWYRFDSKSKTAYLTKLYNWYSGDFEQTAGSVLKYVARYAPEIKEVLDRGDKPTVKWLDYDWSLNAQTNAEKFGGEGK